MYKFYIMSRSLSAGPYLLHLGVEAGAAETPDALVAALRKLLPASGLVAVRGFVLEPSWAGTGGGHAQVGVVEAATPDVLEALAPSLSTAFAAEPRVSIYRELGSIAADGRQRTGSAILHVNVDVAPEHRERFLPWYVDEHVPAVLEAPGMIAARRFENLRAGEALPETQHTFFTIYEMEDASVIHRPETLEASERGACPPELQPLRRAYNRVYSEIFAQEAEA